MNTFLIGQETITLKNPSFEDEPRMAISPKGWYDFGFPTESPTDIHSFNTTFFDVSHAPSQGDIYIGMIIKSFSLIMEIY